MKKSTVLTGIALLGVAAIVSLGGCSDDSGSTDQGFVQRVLDSVAVAVAENLESVGDTAADETSTVIEVEAAGADESAEGAIGDMVIAQNRVYAVSNGGLTVYDLGSRETKTIPINEQLTAVAGHQGEIFVGGADLYAFTDGSLTPVEHNLVGSITALYSWGDNLMVGTTYGLYSKTMLGFFPLLDRMEITAITADSEGLWIGTAGDGLYRYDGAEFIRRYLKRDPTLFDVVNTIAFNHDHLYIGTPAGMYIFDGGQWLTLTVDDGLPSNNVTSIDASRWVVHAATDAGLVTWYNKQLAPIDRLDDQPAQVVRVLGRKIFVGTARDGLLLKSGPAVTLLTSPPVQPESGMVSVAP